MRGKGEEEGREERMKGKGEEGEGNVEKREKMALRGEPLRLFRLDSILLLPNYSIYPCVSLLFYIARSLFFFFDTIINDTKRMAFSCSCNVEVISYAAGELSPRVCQEGRCGWPGDSSGGKEVHEMIDESYVK